MHYIARHQSYSFSKLNTLSLKIGINIFFIKNLWECENFLICQKTDKRVSYQELEKTNIGRFYVKVANNRFDRTHCDDRLQNVLFIYVVLVLPDSVETQLGRSGKFNYFVEYSFLFPLVQKL